jgi:hypothetical protein
MIASLEINLQRRYKSEPKPKLDLKPNIRRRENFLERELEGRGGVG